MSTRNIWREHQRALHLPGDQKNKFNFFWDEQDFCQDPCDGVVSVFTSPESWWSVPDQPNRLQQVDVDEPAHQHDPARGRSDGDAQHYDTTQHREYRNPPDIPRVIEFGDTAGGDSVAPRGVNQFAGSAFFALTVRIAQERHGRRRRRAARHRRLAPARVDLLRHRHAQRQVRLRRRLLHADQTNQVNDTRLTYHYARAATRPAPPRCHVRQHEPAITRGPEQPGAPAGALTACSINTGVGDLSTTGCGTARSTPRISGRSSGSR